MILQKFDKLLDISKMSESDKNEYVAKLKREAFLCDQLQQTIKTELVSIYGALGNVNYHFANFDFAEAITLQGQHAIKHSEIATNDYFLNHFHNDRELLTHLGVPENVTINPLKKNVVVYIDTDSNYCTFDEVRKNIGWRGGDAELVLKIYNFRLKEYFANLFKQYAKDINAMGDYLDFELETISSIGLFIAKKKYLHSVIWKDEVTYENLTELKITGIEIVQRSTPIFCRNYLKESVKQILQMGGLSDDDGTLLKYIKNLREIKKAHAKSNLELICKTNKISDYSKFVLDDFETLRIKKGCPIHVRAAATYNFLVNKSGLKNKYELIKSGDSIKWYYTDDKQHRVFGYLNGYYPEEFAPKYNYKTMFEKTFVNVVNRFVNSMMTNTNLDYSLAHTQSFF
jgi:DNA polymerase elongation subunit (family B)